MNKVHNFLLWKILFQKISVYNSLKVNWFSPEEATSQNINYLVCSGFTRNVYRELLNTIYNDFQV